MESPPPAVIAVPDQGRTEVCCLTRMPVGAEAALEPSAPGWMLTSHANLPFPRCLPRTPSSTVNSLLRSLHTDPKWVLLPSRPPEVTWSNVLQDQSLSSVELSIHPPSQCCYGRTLGSGTPLTFVTSTRVMSNALFM